ncbi:hypothetical protein SAY86_028169 [Trapa natans]|uniref:CP-type G domain-containing protein n=1 Tax=Trapa natans TaxID=22666 RepID=A0AAN7RG55_TRANT|nr:hypothetical protein SAY86_028169 [Trapa natans]
MASKTLSTFLYPFPLPQRFTEPSPKFIIIQRKPDHPIVCKSAQSDAGYRTLGTGAEPEGIGAASPTRGDMFLEHQQSKEAAKRVTREFKKQGKLRKDKPLMVKTGVASCYGCGAPLQTSELDAPGYVAPDTYALKKKHHQLRTVLCGRCQLLSHGHMITAVGGNGGYPGGKQFVTAEELRKRLSHLRHEKALIVKLVDIVDFNGSFLTRVRDLVGANPIILVVTKVDLLPKGTDFNCIGDWVVEVTTRKKLNVLGVHLTSAKSLAGIAGVVSEIQKEKKGRDVYILGSANVGKSAFISALLRLMAQKDPVAAAARLYKPVESAVPGTTLGVIQINAFPGGGKLFDTPGVHLHHRQAAVIHSEDLPVLAPQNRLRGQSFPIRGKTDNDGLNGLSIFWGGLVRIDVLKVLPETQLTFYGPRALEIHVVPTNEADEFYQNQLGILLTPPTGRDRASEWKGLETQRQLCVKVRDIDRPACDVAISGLGWIAIEPVKRLPGNPNVEDVGSSHELHFTVHIPRPVEVFVRPPMPVAKAGAEWYQYQELTEKEEEVRPKWNF